MYIERVPNRDSPPCVLLRESYRVEGKVRKRTLLNLTSWPVELVEGLRALLRGAVAVESLPDTFEVVRSLPHGHVAAVLGTLRRVGLERLLSEQRCPERDLVVAMIVARVVHPCSKLATARGLSQETRTSTLGELLGREEVSEDELYRAMDWLLERQERIERSLAKQHLADGMLVLYDVTSVYFEGRSCPLARYGHSRDGKKGKLQIVFGLLCTAQGVPVAVDVFTGNTADPKTLQSQVRKLRDRFGLSRIVFVGDRGLLTEARIDEELRGVEGLDWISALTAPQVCALVQAGPLQLSLFDEQDLAEIHSPDYPGERLIACRNPYLAEDRARTREELLRATEKKLDEIVAATRRVQRPLRGKERIGMRVGRVLGRFKVGKHFILRITEESFQYERDAERIAQEAALDGIYIIRTSLPGEALRAEQTVRAYKRLSVVERAFRSLKGIDLSLRLIHHHRADRVRAHVFLCLLAYYVEWHMRQALAPILFDDAEPEAAEPLRGSVVAPAKRSADAQRKARRKRTAEQLPVHSFQSLLGDLGTIVKSRYQPKLPNVPAFDKTTRPTPLQQRALDLLSVRL